MWGNSPHHEFHSELQDCPEHPVGLDDVRWHGKQTDELESSLASASASDGAAMLGAAMLAVSSSYFMSSIVTAPFFVPWASCRHEAMVALQVVGVRLQLSHCPESLGLTWTCRAWSCMLKSTQHATKKVTL